MRKTNFSNNEYYHIYNRGVDKRDIFVDDQDFVRFIRSMKEFNTTETIGSLYEKDFRDKLGSTKEAKLPIGSLASSGQQLIELVSYCLNRNHFHLSLKQLVENGINKFMHKLGTGYTKYFNQKYKRSGSLFQGTFKAKHIDTSKYFLWLSGYVNGNPEIHNLTTAKNYQWSSYQDYLGLRNGTLVNKEIVLNEFNNNLKDYKNFVSTVINDSRKRKEGIKEYLKDLE